MTTTAGPTAEQIDAAPAPVRMTPEQVARVAALLRPHLPALLAAGDLAVPGRDQQTSTAQPA